MDGRQRDHGGDRHRAQTQCAAQQHHGDDGQREEKRRQQPRPAQRIAADRDPEFQQEIKERRMNGILADGAQQAHPVLLGHSHAEDFIAIHADGRAVVHPHRHIDGDDRQEHPSLHLPAHEPAAPICRATLPPVKRWNVTLANPARRISSASSGAAGNLRIDSGRYAISVAAAGEQAADPRQHAPRIEAV